MVHYTPDRAKRENRLGWLIVIGFVAFLIILNQIVMRLPQ